MAWAKWAIGTTARLRCNVDHLRNVHFGDCDSGSSSGYADTGDDSGKGVTVQPHVEPRPVEDLNIVRGDGRRGKTTANGFIASSES